MFPKPELAKNFPPSRESGVVELSLMLARQQFEALEERARFEGMSIAQFLRRLVNDATSQEAVAG